MLPVFDINVHSVAYLTHSKNLNSYYELSFEIKQAHSEFRQLKAICQGSGMMFAVLENNRLVPDEEVFLKPLQKEAFVRYMDNAIQTWEELTLQRINELREKHNPLPDMTLFAATSYAEA